jgi:hypothetical protein
MNTKQFVTDKNPNGHRARVSYHDAQHALLHNLTVIIGGNVRHFAILDIGLGVYEVGLQPKDCFNGTTLVKNFIPALKEDGTRMFPDI